MAEQSGFFDAHLVDGEYDRVYLAASFAKYFASFIGNGIFAGKSSELTVRQKSSANMSVKVSAGQGWINGYWYENTDELSLAIDIADGVLNRIDIVVLRWDSSQRDIRLAVKKGTPASNPAAPSIQRDADKFELKLAQINIKAGATAITQVDISDSRLDSAVCGFVHGVVEQFDAQEFGEQLAAFIENFMVEHENWSTQFKAASNKSVNDLLTESQSRVDTLITNGQTNLNKTASDGQAKIDKVAADGQANINSVASTGQTNLAKVASDGQTSINNVVQAGTASINKLLTDKTAEANQVISQGQKNFNDLDAEAKAWFNTFKLESEEDVATLIARLEGLVDTNDLAALNERLVAAVSRIVTLESLTIEHTTYKGCYYRIVNNETEWINAPNEPGIEYRTTERWNNKPVYKKTFYLGALSNKTIMGIEVQADWNKIISIDGYAQSEDDMYFYPFPIILSGLTPAAAIIRVESNGDNEGVIVIQVNDDLTYLKAYVSIKYTKE